MKTRRSILVFGSTGQVGWELQRTLSSLGEVVASSICGSFGPKVDFADADDLRGLIRELRPWVVVNAAAYTAVDKAEIDQDMARTINADALGMIGESARSIGAGVVHYSTDFVFSGESRTPYREDDAPGPIGVYGQTKLEGEQQLLASGADALIFRTSWVYGLRGQNFLLTMQRLIRERDELGVVDDQVGSPTWSRMLAEVTGQVLARCASGDFGLGDVKGLYHLTAAGQTSWYGFARAIWEAAGSHCRLNRIATSDYPTPARRPAYSVLDNSRFQETFGLVLPNWHTSLIQCLQDQTP